MDGMSLWLVAAISHCLGTYFRPSRIDQFAFNTYTGKSQTETLNAFSSLLPCLALLEEDGLTHEPFLMMCPSTYCGI